MTAVRRPFWIAPAACGLLAAGCGKPPPPPTGPPSANSAPPATSPIPVSANSAPPAPALKGTEGSPSGASAFTEAAGPVPLDEYNPAAKAGPAPAPTTGGDLVVGFSAEPKLLSDLLDNSAYTQYITGYVFETLLIQNKESFVPEPWLAESYVQEDVVVRADGTEVRGKAEKTPDGGVKVTDGAGVRILPAADVKQVKQGVAFTFRLRDGVKFHDGHPLTTEDVAFSFRTIKCEYVNAPALRNYYEKLNRCEVLDPRTIRLTYDEQYWQAWQFAGGFGILPRHLLDPDGLLEKDPKAFAERFNSHDFHRAPVGTGPYRFEKWDRNTQIVLRRHEGYWNAPKAGRLDRLLFVFIPEAASAFKAFTTGKIGFLPVMTPEQFHKELAKPELASRFVRAPHYTGGFGYIGWNLRRPPFDDRNVRLAMAHGALNIPEFIRTVLYGVAEQVTGPQYRFGPAYDPSVAPFPYDPGKAEELLLEAGWFDRDGDGIRDKGGRTLDFEMLMPQGNETVRKAMAVMHDNLQKLGVVMRVKELEWSAFIEAINKRNFDACRLGWATDLESDPYQLWHSTQTENEGSNHCGFVNAEADRIIETSRVTLDDAARRKLFFRLHRIIYDEQPYLFLWITPDYSAYLPPYRGVKFYKLRPGYDLSEWFIPK